jgi:hypothetical protein
VSGLDDRVDERRRDRSRLLMPEAVNDIRNWRIVDPRPGEPLDSITPYSMRARVLVARGASNPILQTSFLQLAGAVSILQGLDYHRDRFVSLISGLAGGAETDEGHLLHEAIAYINRVGQFYYFAESDLVKTRIGRLLTPTMDALVKFRHKHTAHRSIDKPRVEDTQQLQTVHAMTLSEFGGRLWHPKEKLPPGFVGPYWGRAYLVYQIHTGSKDVFELVIERDHERLMAEAYEIIRRLLM